MESHALARGLQLGLDHAWQDSRGLFHVYPCYGLCRPWRTEGKGFMKPRFNTITATQKNSTSKMKRFDNFLERQLACISSFSQETSSVGVSASPVSPPPSNLCSLFWVGVGIGLATLFRFVALNLQKYDMRQLFKFMEGKTKSENNDFSNTTICPRSNLTASSSFDNITAAGASSTKMEASSSSVINHMVAEDVPATEVEATYASSATHEMTKDIKRPKNHAEYAFKDVSVDKTKADDELGNTGHIPLAVSPRTSLDNKVSENGILYKKGRTQTHMDNEQNGKTNPTISIEAIEKMMLDQKIQNIMYPYLPKEMRNPAMFKWMIQNPQYRKQFEDMVKKLTGNNQENNALQGFVKNFDINSPQVKQKFDQLGLTPEYIFKTLMENPKIASALQKPRVQAAMFEFSQNPNCISKYENDKEIMDVLNVISEVFKRKPSS